MTRNRGDKLYAKFENLEFANKYSIKNISIPKRNDYMKKLIAQMEKIVKRMRWTALFFWKKQNFTRKKTHTALKRRKSHRQLKKWRPLRKTFTK